MISLTVFEQSLRRHLIRIASDGTTDAAVASCVTYGEFGKLVDPDGLRASGPTPHTRGPFRGLNEALGHVCMYEVEHGRPMLTALIVSAETRTPGAGFTKLAEHLGFEVEDPELFWQIELARVVDFWSSDDPTGSVDAAVECLMDELVAIKALLRRSSGSRTNPPAKARVSHAPASAQTGDAQGDPIELVVAACSELLPEPSSWDTFDGYPKSLALCVIDSIWSMGVRYGNVIAILNRYRAYRMQQGQDASLDNLSDLLAVFEELGVDGFIEQIGNRQKVSTARSCNQRKRGSERCGGPP